ncbi:MAG TPA: 4-hydroxybutyrate CoA-transferase, partial [Bacteroidetes bacterium]|nr:4-hydroxybutyrate CoA-transferase [Bacteroidota bacterium]
MGWIDPYRGKVVSPEEAVSVVKSGDRIYMSGNAATPYVLLDALAERKDELRDVELTHLLLLGKDPLSGPGMAGHFRHRSLFVGPADRKAVHEGRADYVPVFLNEIPGLFASGILPIDVAVVHTSRPDEHGFLS